MLFLCCLILKVKVLVETDEVFEVLSPELRAEIRTAIVRSAISPVAPAVAKTARVRL